MRKSAPALAKYFIFFSCRILLGSGRLDIDKRENKYVFYRSCLVYPILNIQLTIVKYPGTKPTNWLVN